MSDVSVAHLEPCPRCGVLCVVLRHTCTCQDCAAELAAAQTREPLPPAGLPCEGEAA